MLFFLIVSMFECVHFRCGRRPSIFFLPTIIAQGYSLQSMQCSNFFSTAHARIRQILQFMNTLSDLHPSHWSCNVRLSLQSTLCDRRNVFSSGSDQKVE